MKGLFHPSYKIPWCLLEKFLQTMPSCLELYPFVVCATAAEIQISYQTCSCIFQKLQGSSVILVGLYTCQDEDMIRNLAKKYCFSVSFGCAEATLTAKEIKALLPSKKEPSNCPPYKSTYTPSPNPSSPRNKKPWPNF
jgi:hypothetical protein